jgi:glycosyltransferase involved in cell wall biosynthesis
MNKKKVLIIGPSRKFLGGVSNYYNIVLPKLTATDSLLIKYIEIGSENKPMLRFISPLFDLIKISFFIVYFRPSIVHLNPSLNTKAIIRDSLFALIARVFGVKLIVFFRGWNVNNQWLFETFLLKKLTKILLLADRYLVLNTTVEKYLIAKKVNPSNISRATTVIPDSYSMSDIYIEQSISKEKIRLLFLGRVVVEKGLYELVSSMKKLHGKATLTIVGDGDAWNDLYDEIRQDNKLNAMINIKHSITGRDKLSCYLEHDVFILPSYSEGMPNSILEAMALGLVVVGSSVGALPSLISKYGGLIVRPKSDKSIVSAINKITDDKQYYYSESSKKRNIVKNNFSAYCVRDYLLHEYNILLRM